MQKTGEEWLLIRPNQVHHFLSMQDWDGWGLSFPAELLPAHLTQEWQNLPYRQVVDASHAELLLSALTQLKRCRYADWQNINAQSLIQAQLQAFLTLLITLYAQKTQPEDK